MTQEVETKHKACYELYNTLKNPFNGLACVPTLDGNVVKAESLYSLHIRDKVALLTDGEKLLPLDIVAEGVLVDENSASKESVYFMDKLSFKIC